MIGMVRRRLQAVRDDREAGVSIMELIISMLIFSFVLVVFMGAIVSMVRATSRNQVVSDTSTQLRTVYQRLDKEVRYASDINTPGTSGGNIYIEYWMPASAATGQSTCVQWRYVAASKELQRRSWLQGDPSSVTPWITMVTRLRNDLSQSTQQPFVVYRAGAFGGKVYTHQRLDVFLDSGLSSSPNQGGQLKVSLVAQNSATTSVTNTGTQKVCLVGGVQRP
ncbi:MAG: hypothetical protein ABUL56_03525 [Actinomycetota bacterium]